MSAGAKEILEALARSNSGREHTYKMTPLGMWACSDAQELHDLFAQVDMRRYRHMADLGSGDGRAVLLASLFTQATGIEIDPELVNQARSLALSLGLERADFILGDCREADLSLYDLLFLYPDKPLDWLERILAKHAWQGHLLIYGPYFKPQAMAHLKTIYAGSTICGLWAA